MQFMSKIWHTQYNGTLFLTVVMLSFTMLKVIILRVVVPLSKDKATAEWCSNTNALMSLTKLNMIIKS
jgi:hypothetical protein